jgi:SAM-dependent methyltransferase
VDIQVDPGNREQAEAWNGDEGRGWVARADRYEASAAAYLPHLLDAATLAAADAVLDVGCGNGGSTCAAAREVAGGHALGVDLSGPMVVEARLRAAAAGVTNATFEQADAQVHPFAPEAFDVMISKFCVMFFADPRAAFANLARALRPGGRVAVLAWRGLGDNAWMRLPREALAAGRDLPVPPVGMPGPFGFADDARNRDALEAAGLVDVTHVALYEPVVLGVDVDDAVEFITSGSLGRGLLADLDVASRARAIDALRAVIEAHSTPDGVQLGGSAWLVTARRA